MKIIVTCGPGHEQIDQVRRITNFSTGELGFLLSTSLTQAGHDVTCLKGELSTSHEPLEASRVLTFSTNESLLKHLTQISQEDGVEAVLHTAALCDYRVASIQSADGADVAAAKIPSREGNLVLHLRPAEKVIRHLRRLFPTSYLLGWKYELDGTREDALGTAITQIEHNKTDACVLNGKAFGKGFGFVQKGAGTHTLATKAELAAFICKLLSARKNMSGAEGA